MTEVEPRGRAAPAFVSRLVDTAEAVGRWTLRLALVSTAAAALIVYAIVRDGFPSGGKGVLAAFGIVAAAAPPLLLASFFVALGGLVRLPERVRRIPFDGREHGAQLRRLVEDARAARGGRLQVPRVLWRLLRLAGRARDTVTPYAPLLPFLSLPFLAATAAASLAALIEIVVACVLVLILVFA